jgi:hypothetical protein
MTATTQRTLTFDAKVGVLWIKDARSEKGYFVDRIHGTQGGQGFSLCKIIPPASDDEPREYSVLLSDGGPAHDVCDCRGAIMLAGRKPCRHVAAMRCLKTRGKI